MDLVPPIKFSQGNSGCAPGEELGFDSLRAKPRVRIPSP